MAFKEVLDLNCDLTVSLGGTNKKTGKKNPVQIEGYFLGKREVEDRKKKSGVSYIYVFQTSQGNVGVWGKTDLDRKMLSAQLGEMMIITQTGMQETANGPMYKYSVKHDPDNTIEVSPAAAPTEAPQAASTFSEDEEESSLDEEEALDEVVTTRKIAAGPAAKVDGDRQAKIQALLNGGKNKVS